VLAALVALTVLLLWVRARRQALSPWTRFGVHLFLAMALIQVGLGIGTLLLHVPTPLAAAHQANALLLFTVALFTNHTLRAQRSND
jgi:cytochrome c oxidase assembly protein subunit 15